MRFCFPALFLCGCLGAQTIEIVNGRVFDGTGPAVKSGRIYIRGERLRISEVSLPADRTIDAAGLTILPGLFDLHTHLAASGSSARADWGKNLKSYLLNGVTDVVDMSTYPETYEPMRRMLKLFSAPHDFIAARITTPGGHGAEAGRGDIFSLEVLTPREGRRAVQRVLADHPDLIKVFTDGWRYNTAPDMTSMDEATLAAIVDEAHKNGLPVLTHTVTLGRAKMAARAGVDVLAHGIGDAYVDAELIGLLKEHHTTYVSTLAVYEPRGTPSKERGARWANLIHNVAALRDAGITLAVGTDAGEPGTPHGAATQHELELLVRAGLTPREALMAGTFNSARALRVAEDRGTIANGMRADLVLVEGAPGENIADIHKIRRVFLSGRDVDLAQLSREVAQPGPTPLPAIAAQPLIDDFERQDGRSNLGTLPINNTDAGHDHSRILYTRITRSGANHAMSVIARMSEKDKPFARFLIPLSRGGFEPVDASRFHGISMQVRGDGQYSEVLLSRTSAFTAGFTASGHWQTVKIPFSAFQAEKGQAVWTGRDLTLAGVELARPAGQTVWLELDQVKFW
ncbi:MAG: CIA30 family protein [Acidobacteriota bacterium]|nr:CIA30 family protein [Acidobacteriota bacterium]